MVDALNSNNGDVLVCIIILCDTIAQENNCGVVVETHHQQGCTLVDQMEGRLWPKEFNKPDLTNGEAMAHLYSCDCDTNIEAIYSKPGGEMFWVPLLLSDIRRECPWMNNDQATKEMLATVKESGPDSLLVTKMKALFQKHVGHHYMSGLSPYIHSDTVH